MIRRTASTSVSPCLSIYSTFVARKSNKSLFIPVQLASNQEKNQIVETEGLVDSGAGGVFIDQNFARRKKLPLKKLDKPLPVFNVDGTPNKKGTITQSTTLDLNISGRTKPVEFYITGLGRQNLILGFPWLEEENPDIDWKQGTVKWRKPSVKLEDEEDFEGIQKNPLPTESVSLIQALDDEEVPELEKTEDTEDEDYDPDLDQETDLLISFLNGTPTPTTE